MKEIQIRLLSESEADLNLIGIHASFRWKHRLVPGITYREVIDLKPDGFINVIDNVNEICERNNKNPKWDMDTSPNLQDTQDWMIEEEFITKLLADITGKPYFLIARKHNVDNIFDLFFSTKKKIYLSFPITCIKESNPEIISKIRGEYLKKLEDLFIVFDPLSIKDMDLTSLMKEKEMPELIGQLTESAKETIKKRTIETDFQFIDQSDAVVVLYMTDKVSPGVLAEVYYAHRNQKPVFMVFPEKRSPFIEDATDFIASDFESLLPKLIDFSK